MCSMTTTWRCWRDRASSWRARSGRGQGRCMRPFPAPAAPTRWPILIRGTASRVGASIMLSCRLAPLSVRPSGVPRASVTRWRFVPGLPRSVGFGPVADPPPSPGQRRCPAKPGSNPVVPHPPGAPVTPCATRPTRPLAASRAACASRSCRNHTPSRPADTPTASPCAARTGCRLALHGRAPAACRHAGGVARAATGVR